MVDDRSFVRKKFIKNFDSVPDFSCPQKYNEHIAQISLEFKDPRAVICADKFQVRAYVQQKQLGFLLNECFGVYSSADEVLANFDNLPEQFVLKATHGCGWNFICTQKSRINKKKLLIELDHWLKSNFYYAQREWIYKNIPPRIIAEKYLVDETGELRDYKFHCHRGEPKYINVISGRRSEMILNTYDTEWNFIDVNYGPNYPNNKNVLNSKPSKLNEIFDYCRVLSKDFEYVRVDFYIINEKPIFGELTFTPGNGTYHFTLEQDLYFGKFFAAEEN